MVAAIVLSLFSVIVYQNCSPVRFSKMELAETGPQPPICVDLPSTPEDDCLGTLGGDDDTTTTTTTTTLPGETPTVPTTVTTTLPPPVPPPVVIQDNQMTFSATIASDIHLPQIEFKFIVDHSYSMQLNNTNMTSAIDVMFNSSVGTNTLRDFNVTGEVYNTASRVDTASAYDLFGMYRDAFGGYDYLYSGTTSQDQYDAANFTSSNSTALYAYNRNNRPLLRIPGDVLGVSVVNNTKKNFYNNIPVVNTYIRVDEKLILPQPVVLIKNDQLEKTSYSNNSSVNNYDLFVNEIKEKMQIIQPEKVSTFLGLPSNSSAFNLVDVKNNFVSKESGLCQIARIMKNKSNQLARLTPEQLTVYQQKSSREVFVLASDEDDFYSDGASCVERRIARNYSSYNCEQNVYQVNFDFNQKSRGSCWALRKPANFQITYEKEGTETKVDYQLKGTRTQTTSNLCDGTVYVNETGSHCTTGFYSKTDTVDTYTDQNPFYVSGDFTGKCNFNSFQSLSTSFGASFNSLTAVNFRCTKVTNINNGKGIGNPVNTMQGYLHWKKYGGLSAAEIEGLWGGAYDASKAIACSPTIIEELKRCTAGTISSADKPGNCAAYGDAASGSNNYAYMYDVNQYTIKNCKLIQMPEGSSGRFSSGYFDLDKNGTGETWDFKADQASECETAMSDTCPRAYDVDAKYCGYNFTPGVNDVGTRSIRFLVPDEQDVSQYSGTTNCKKFSSGHPSDGSFGASVLFGDACIKNPTDSIKEVIENDAKNMKIYDLLRFNNSSKVYSNIQFKSISKNAYDNKYVFSKKTYKDTPSCAYPTVLTDLRTPYTHPQYISSDSHITEFVTGTVDNSTNQIVNIDLTTAAGNPVTRPAKDLITYILDQTDELNKKFKVKIPVVKVLAKDISSDANEIQKRNINGQSAGSKYIDLVNKYQQRFGSDYASMTNLIESGTDQELNRYYSNTFQGLTSSIRSTVKLLYPIQLETSPGVLEHIDYLSIEAVNDLCVNETDVNGVISCVTVNPNFYDILSLNPDTLSTGGFKAYLLMKSDLAIKMKKGMKFSLKLKMKK
jgi:hypothetical protein